MMNTQQQFQLNQQFTTNNLYDSGMEQKILAFWRENNPQLVEDLIHKQMLNRTLVRTASDLLDLQIDLEKTQKLPPSLAAMEAWRVIMRLPETDEESEEGNRSEMDL